MEIKIVREVGVSKMKRISGYVRHIYIIASEMNGSDLSCQLALASTVEEIWKLTYVRFFFFANHLWTTQMFIEEAGH